MCDMLDPPQVAAERQQGQQDDDRGDKPVRGQNVRCAGQADGSQRELGEQLQVIGNRHRIGEREHHLRHPPEPHDRIVEAGACAMVLDVDDVEADHAADRLGEQQQCSHRQDRSPAEILGEQRSGDQEPAADDRGERRDGGSPRIGMREASEAQQRGRPDRDEDRAMIVISMVFVTLR